VEASSQPVLMAVDDDAEALDRIRGALNRRYGSDYRIVCGSSTEAAIERLEEMRAADDRVSLVLADVWMSERPQGAELLGHVRRLHPHAKRALLIDWGAWGHRPTADVLLHAMATGRIDYYVLKPGHVGDEQFHRIVAEFLHEWSREHSSDAFELSVVGDPGESRTHQIRDLLRRSGIPHGFQPSDDSPSLRMRDGRTLADPTNEEIVEAFGVDTAPVDEYQFDLVIVGAGPAGLSAAVYASSEGLRTLVIERETMGGQASSSSLIRNYLGFSRGVSGSELAQRAYQQAWVFGTRFAVSRDVRGLQLAEHPYGIGCDAGYVATAGAVLLATGATYRRLGIEGLEHLTGAGVYYGSSTVEGLGLANEDVYVVGGGNSAGQAALHLSRSAGRVRILVRGMSLADDMSQYLRRTIEATPNIEVMNGTEVTDGGGEDRVEWLELSRWTGERERVEAAALFVLIGAVPRTEWLPAEIALHPSGHVLTGQDVLAAGIGWPLERRPTTYETSVPGVFAVGDTRYGAVKRVASAVGEGSVVIPDVHEWLASRGG
jgi:thioredoxin reductase (NADPH)